MLPVDMIDGIACASSKACSRSDQMRKNKSTCRIVKVTNAALSGNIKKG